MHKKPVALVTGANQGIGLQIAKDLVTHGFTVLVGSRNLQRGEVAAKEVGPDARALQLDVTDQASIAAAAERIRKDFGHLDVLVNNAAISNTSKQPSMSVQEYAKLTRPSNVSLAEMRAVWDTNVFGVLAVTQAMLPLLREAPAARIVNVSSGVGSLTRNSDPASPWRSIFGPVIPRPRRLLTPSRSPWRLSWSQPASRSTPLARATPRRTSTTIPARGPCRKAPANQSASRCSVRTVQRALSQTRMARSRGDVVAGKV
jgi:NAD(P)-dependent dehydrogenase (short-subunit alcohol dehydrogenase family)